MNNITRAELIEKLVENHETQFTYKNYYIDIFQRSDGDYEFSIYINKSHYTAGGNPIDGGIFELDEEDGSLFDLIDSAIFTADMIIERNR